jgi:hypothetical protein
MGKWAKDSTKKPLQHVTDPKGFAKRRWNALKGEFEPEIPGETSEERALKNRQARELGKLDEEENRRIKSMFAAGGGRKLFRNARPSASSRTGGSAAASSGGSAAASGGGASAGGYGGGYGGGRGSRSVLP